MPKINVLPRHIAELIAAGEVVERPASVVKELCENALDAGASAVTVEIRRGGVAYIRVTDNGCGIAREDIRSAFVSHATSKISRAGDLDSILSLGFRGEALASIAAVSRVQLLTRTAEEELGLSYHIEGGAETGFEDAGCPVGSTMIIRELFYNVPARMKFLKKDVTEGNAVGAVLERAALSRPDVAFTFLREGREVFRTPGDGSPAGAVRAVLGKAFYEQLIGVKQVQNGVELSGFVCVPEAARPNRNMQYFFLNGRSVRLPAASAALSEAYKSTIMAGKYPSCVLWLTIPPSWVDVNVHPAKTEVRFADERPIFQAVHGAAQFNSQFSILNSQFYSQSNSQSNSQINSQSNSSFNSPFNSQINSPSSSDAHGDIQALSDALEERANPLPPMRETPLLIRTPSAPVVASLPTMEAAEEPAMEPCELRMENYQGFRVIGELFRSYFLAERGDELLLIDKHAAHERMIYEGLKAAQGEARRQILLEPQPLTLSREESAALLEHMALLEQAGFLLESFGGDTLLLRECPMHLAGQDASALLAEIAGRLMEKRADATSAALEKIWHSAACRMAVKAGDFTTNEERDRFIERLVKMPDIRHCPHGRPVIIAISKKELEKRFGRLG